MLLQSNANGTIGPALDSALLGRDSIRDSDRYRANAIHDSNNNNYNYNVDNLTNIVESSLYHIFRCGSKRCQFQNKLIPVNNLLKENFTLIIFYLFSLYLNWSRMGFYHPVYKNERFLSSKTHLLIPFAQDMAFYLLTYFNDVNGGRNILINSQLKRILYMSSNKKK